MALPPLPQGQIESITSGSIPVVSLGGHCDSMCFSYTNSIMVLLLRWCLRCIICPVLVFRLPQHKHCLLAHLHQAAERNENRMLGMGYTGYTKGLGFSAVHRCFAASPSD